MWWCLCGWSAMGSPPNDWADLRGRGLGVFLLVLPQDLGQAHELHHARLGGLQPQPERLGRGAGLGGRQIQHLSGAVFLSGFAIRLLRRGPMVWDLAVSGVCGCVVVGK